VHRIVAIGILCLVGFVAWLTLRNLGWQNPLARISTAWLMLIATQFLLGAATIWTGKSADIATAHVAVGALSLMTGTMLSIISLRCLVPAAKPMRAVAKVEPKPVPFAGGANAAPDVR
jgi:cytochrome c oxidase assembly protein subunit 15